MCKLWMMEKWTAETAQVRRLILYPLPERIKCQRNTNTMCKDFVFTRFHSTSRLEIVDAMEKIYCSGFEIFISSLGVHTSYI